MRRIVEKLPIWKIELGELDALEVFGGDGSWQTYVYADKVKSLEVWEWDGDKVKTCKQNLPNAEVVQGDSFELKTEKKDLIVIDNPQNVYGHHKCEHFDFLPRLPELLNKGGIVIFNINKDPFGDNIEWDLRRRLYYGRTKISTSYALDFYEELFTRQGWQVKFSFEEPRNDYLSYLVFQLE
jgi:spermidine synthase